MSEENNRPITIIDPLTITNYTPFIDPIPPLTIENAMEGELIVACFSKAYLPYIAALIEPLVWADRFEGTEEQRAHSAALFEDLRFILVKGGNCMFDPCCEGDGEKLTALISLIEINNTNQIEIINNQTTVINQTNEVIYQNAVNQYNEWVTNNTAVSVYNQQLYDGTPQSINPNIGENWDDDNDILCAAIRRWIDYVIYAETLTITQEAQATAAITTAFAAALIAAAAPTAGIGAVAGIVVGAVGALAGFAFNNWLAAMNDPELRRKVYCCMYENMQEQPVTEESFASSVDDCGFDGFSPEANIAVRVQTYNRAQANYLAFLRMLGQTTSGNEADCMCDCDNAAEIVTSGEYGNVVTNMGNCIYRSVQSNPVEEPAGSGIMRYYHGWKDLLDRCIFIEQVPFGSEYATLPTSDHRETDCEGNDLGWGVGGGGGTVKLMSFRMGVGAQYYKITLAE